MKNSRILVRIFSMLLVVLTICTVFTTTAFAATSSSGKSTRTITVSTKANWLIPGSESITLSQTKGVRSEKNPFTGKVKTKNCYGEWDIGKVRYWVYIEKFCSQTHRRSIFT